MELCIIGFLIVFISFLIVYIYKLKKNIQKQVDIKFQEEKIKTQRIFENEQKILRAQINSLTEKRDLIVQHEQEMINEKLNYYKHKAVEQIEENLEKFYSTKEQDFLDSLEHFLNTSTEARAHAKKELQDILNEIEDFRKRREVINEAIVREKLIQEQQNFYKLLLTECDIQDIEILETIRPKLSNKEALSKLIYDVFYKKPLNELTKRLTQNNKISGIYKITYLVTNEAYIGRSVDCGNRWKEHLLSSLGIGTIAHSSFHNRLARDGAWNYSWEILETVPKDKLSEREKYWIDFYETNKFGLNDKKGG